MYSDEVMKHFKHPKNMGELENPDGVGEVGNPICGDMMKITIKVEKNKEGKETIKNIKFKTFGCISAIATSSITTEMAKGKTLGDAKRISDQDVIEELGGLPPIKHHCSVLAARALKKAIEDYRSKKK